MSIILLLGLSLIGLCAGQGNPCSLEGAQDSCDVCISTSHRCSWCPYTPNDPILRTNPRCDLAEGRVCGVNVTLENPQPSVEVIRNEPLSTMASFESIQVSPQNITLNLRAQMAEKFNMTFVSLRNAPLDVYILLDLSSSLAAVLRVLQNDLSEIANSLGNISSDFQMGFGSFVDKNTRPFALHSYEVNAAGTVRCRSFGQCENTYSFRNSQPLTRNISEIENAVNTSARLSSNVDAPEGGLEALLQVAVCANETGWRPNALHMVFLITDQGYHVAGDGKLAGINQPNDGKCHVERSEEHRFEYNYGLLQDYPSVFQVQDVLEQNNVVPIFAAQFASEFLNIAYGQLIQDLSRVGARYVIFGADGAAAIIRAIRESYEETVQSIRVIDPAIPGYRFDVTPVEGCNVSETSGACILQFDQEVVFEVSVTLEDCSAARPVGVQLRGPPFIFTYVNLNPVCQCNCSKQSPELGSEFCTLRGNLQCGLCDCGTNYFGESCECNDTITECPTGTVGGEQLTCSGRGICTTCGECQCLNDTFGNACQCDEQSCLNNCDGRGQCLCEAPPRCQCDVDPVSGFSYFQRTVGDSAGCVCNPRDCFNPRFPGDLCHNVMDDEPGIQFCRCITSSVTPRATCLCPNNLIPIENNTICAPRTSFCNLNELCARCGIMDITNSSCATSCGNVRYVELENELSAPPGFNVECALQSGACTYTFSYMQNEASEEVYYSIRCSTSRLPWIIAGSLVGLIVLVGILALICLKVAFIVYDRVEYKKFTKDIAVLDATPIENPLYLTPQTEYQNPLRRASRRKKEAEDN